MSQVQKITIKGFKSIQSLVDFELRPLNVLIGANGVGKSNFIGVFKFLAELTGDNFPLAVQNMGGPDALLHYGRKTTSEMILEVYFSKEFSGVSDVANGYRVTLVPTVDNRLIFAREESWFDGYRGARAYTLGAGHDVAKVTTDDVVRSKKVSHYVAQKLKIWRQYHFHDTGDTAAVKRIHSVNDNLRLKPDASNLAAYLRLLYSTPVYQSSYRRIVETIRLAAPFFGDFVFRDSSSETIELEWTERGKPDTPWKAHVLSDGTLRFICLTTLLMQPVHMLPDTILIDEPELGLHPYAINLLVQMLQSAAETNKQVIVSTQSVELLNALSPEDVVVVERVGDATVFKRLVSDDLSDWLEDYALGDLWKRNILGGRPTL
jgi:predicted ATPase